MREKLGWFVILYASISVTVTIVLWVVANKTLRLGGPVGMAKVLFLLMLAVVGFIVWIVKEVFRVNKPGFTPNDQIKQTIRKTSGWIEGLKKEWDSPTLRSLDFPVDHSIGTLYVSPRSAPPGSKWEKLGEAQGSIKVRIDQWWVGLIVSPTASSDLSFLATLQPDDLVSINLAEVSDSGLVYLRRLTGLQILSLVGTWVSDAGVADLQRALPRCRIKR